MSICQILSKAKARRGPARAPSWSLSAAPLEIIVASGFAARFWGVHAWRDWGARPRGLYFPACRAVHSFGLIQPLDIVFLDRLARPIKVVRRCQPGRVVFAWSASAVLELPPGYCSSPAWRARVAAACRELRAH